MRRVTILPDWFVGCCLFPLTNSLMNRRNIMKTYRAYADSERYTDEALADLQLAKLRVLLSYAGDYIPYYRRLFREISFIPEEIKSLEDVRRIPPLSRRDVHEYYREMVDERYVNAMCSADLSERPTGEPVPFGRFKRHRLVRNTSSGSTGSPTVFYDDGTRAAISWAQEMRVKRWYGIPPGAREVRMARLATTYKPEGSSFSWRKHLWHQLILPGTNLSDSEYDLCIHMMNEFRPRVIWGYTPAINGLAEYAVRSGIDGSAFGVKLAIGWAGPLYDHEAMNIRNAFSCPVTNIYGSREIGHIAALCPSGSFHVNQENVLLEKEVSPEGPDGPGELLATTLDLSPMPFIRYRMGDIGKVGPSRCSCGKPLQTVAELLGRTGEVFLTKDGRMISPNFWCRVFMSEEHSESIRRFRVIYTKEKDIRIQIECGPDYSTKTERYITDTVKSNFSNDTACAVECVPAIEPEVSGKYLMVVNEELEMGNRN